ncbi:MAG: DNA oxidative demethylase AlkB [Rhodanobacteraceae bacterium]
MSALTANLFDSLPALDRRDERLCEGAVVLRGFALAAESGIMEGLRAVMLDSSFRCMITPAGKRMSVPMTNCGALGWVSDRRGYRYASIDPLNGNPWPEMPEAFARLACSATAQAGFAGYIPDACLINRYQPGSRLSLHQDKNERDFGQPIVSVSLGVPAVFLFGGLRRADRPERIPLAHGDVVVWGGPARMRYHGIAPIKHAHHEAFGDQRINLTLRKAG